MLYWTEKRMMLSLNLLSFSFYLDYLHQQLHYYVSLVFNPDSAMHFIYQGCADTKFNFPMIRITISPFYDTFHWLPDDCNMHLTLLLTSAVRISFVLWRYRQSVGLWNQCLWIQYKVSDFYIRTINLFTIAANNFFQRFT